MTHWEMCLKNLQKELRHCATIPVYFARAERQGEIKIGFSTQVQSRLYHLGNQRFTNVTLLGWKRGGPAMERKMHERFKEFALGREWFEPAPELLDYLESKTRHDDPPTVASKYGRINDTHFDSLLSAEKRYLRLIAENAPAYA